MVVLPSRSMTMAAVAATFFLLVVVSSSSVLGLKADETLLQHQDQDDGWTLVNTNQQQQQQQPEESASGGHNNIRRHLQKPPKPPAFPSVCVKFAMYDNPRCWGVPKQVVKYPTFKESGHSPCFANPGKAISSIGDQYCDVSGQIYHVNFYPFNSKCDGKPLPLKIPTNGGCSLGVKVFHCKEQPCFFDNDDHILVEDIDIDIDMADDDGVEELLMNDFDDLADDLQATMQENLELLELEEHEMDTE